jgi:hypothetical protein
MYIKEYIVFFINVRISASLEELKNIDLQVDYYFYFRMIYFERSVFMLHTSVKEDNFDKTWEVFIQSLLHNSQLLFS